MWSYGLELTVGELSIILLKAIFTDVVRVVNQSRLKFLK